MNTSNPDVPYFERIATAFAVPLQEATCEEADGTCNEDGDASFEYRSGAHHLTGCGAWASVLSLDALARAGA
jgi:hypothetical protein